MFSLYVCFNIKKCIILVIYLNCFFLIFKYVKNKFNWVIRVIYLVIKFREIIKLYIYGECVIVWLFIVLYGSYEMNEFVVID